MAGGRGAATESTRRARGYGRVQNRVNLVGSWKRLSDGRIAQSLTSYPVRYFAAA